MFITSPRQLLIHRQTDKQQQQHLSARPFEQCQPNCPLCIPQVLPLPHCLCAWHMSSRHKNNLNVQMSADPHGSHQLAGCLGTAEVAPHTVLSGSRHRAPLSSALYSPALDPPWVLDKWIICLCRHPTHTHNPQPHPTSPGCCRVENR